MRARSQISLVLISTLCAFTATATAEPYWYAYEGNDFPENEGWERWVSDPAPERWLEDGNLVIDSRGLVGSTDDYGIPFDSGVDPGPAETFVMSWGLKVEETTHRDPGVYVTADESWCVQFLFDTDSLISFYEPTVYVDIEPYVYHEYEMRSSDMRNYELYIDGDLAIEGAFFEGLFPSAVGFGDTTSSTSLAAWDYFRFGVVPEPSAIWLFVAGLVACVLRAMRSSMRRAVLLPVLACILAASATAEPYWIAYEGNDLPENEGWERVTYNGEANRWIEDGALVIDSLHDPHVEDLAKMERWMDPGPGELFVAEWLLLVEAGSTGYDAGVAIARSFLPGFVSFGFGPDQAWNGLDNLFFDIEPGIYHTYRFESEDMVDFDFLIDGQLVQQGTFLSPSSNQSYINFGDKTDGWASLSRWDYVRFGVIPEPSATWLFVAALAPCVVRSVRGGVRRVVLLPMLACILAASATAEPYWIAYEGNDFPENEGWTRFTGAGGANRWIGDGALVIDSLDDVHIHDVALMEHWMDPEPGELFVAEWRLLVEAGSDDWDAGVAIARSFAPGFVMFGFGPDSVWDALENVWFDIEPGIYHTYRFESSNMVDFHLFVDGQLLHEGAFLSPSSNQSFIGFGDVMDGAVSLSHWDSVCFGVVPEPSAYALALAAVYLIFKAIRKQ